MCQSRECVLGADGCARLGEPRPPGGGVRPASAPEKGPRATADLDLWVAIAPDNAAKLVDVFHRFGMQDPRLTPSLFQARGKIIRIGVPPMRIEVLTEIDGVAFANCHAARVTTEIDGQVVHLISRKRLRPEL